MSETPDLADNPEEVEEIPDEEHAYEALQHVLEEMTSVYHEDGESIDVKLAGRSAAAPGGYLVYVNPDLPDEMDPPVSGPNILRLVDDLLAHEVAHVNWSDLESKKKFAECYPGWGKVPGFVANVLEDEYVDAKRKQTWYGMRSKLAYYVWLHMNTESRAPNVAEVEEEEGRTPALMTAFFQTALAGYAKGLEDASPEIAEFCSYCEPIIQRVRAQDDPDERFKLFHVVMQLLMRYAPDPDEFDPEDAGKRTRESHDGGDGEHGSGEPPEAPDAEEPSMEMPEDMKDELEDMLEEMMDEDDFPEPPSPPETSDEESGDAEGGMSDGEEDESAEDDGMTDDPDGESGGVSDDETDEEPDEDDDSGSDESGGDGDSETTGSGSDEAGRSRDVESVLSKYDPSELKVVN